MFGLPINLIAAGAAITAPFFVYATMKVKSKIDVYQAVKIERSAGISRCNIQLSQVELRHNEKVTETVINAEKAASAVRRPQTPAELRKICERSASCRSRKGYER